MYLWQQLTLSLVLVLVWVWGCAIFIHFYLPDRFYSEWYGYPLNLTMGFGCIAIYVLPMMLFKTRHS